MREPLRFPGVVLKTEYSSAKRGVQPLDSSKRPWLCLGVSKTGLGKTVDVGVRLGVGGAAFGSPKLGERDCQHSKQDNGGTNLGALNREMGASEPGTWLIRTHSRIDSVSNMYPGQRHETMQSVLWVGAGIREAHFESQGGHAADSDGSGESRSGKMSIRFGLRRGAIVF